MSFVDFENAKRVQIFFLGGGNLVVKIPPPPHWEKKMSAFEGNVPIVLQPIYWGFFAHFTSLFDSFRFICCNSVNFLT